jgi:transposase
VDALGNPVRFILTGGQVHDIVQAEDLISGISFEHLLADKGYDANWLRARIAEVGAEAVIPSTRSRSQAIPYDKHIYKERNLVERFFNKIKHFRRIATRYEKTAASFAAMLFLVGAMIWLR